MERNLNEFIDIHKGETAWIFGKGPSLDGFDFADAGALRVGINDLIGLVPDCLYGFSNDSPAAWIDLYQKHHVFFAPKRTADFCTEFPDCSVVIFEDYHGNDLVRDKTDMCRELMLAEGTLNSAVQVLYIMGVSKIVAVGIDGGNRHAKRGQWRTQLNNEHYKQYNRIRERFVTYCEQLGIELKFYTKDREMADGYRTVQFNSNTFVRGNPYEAGMVVRLQESDARDVVYAGRGQVVPDVVRVAELETATVDKAIEVPEKRTIKRTRKRSKQ